MIVSLKKKLLYFFFVIACLNLFISCYKGNPNNNAGIKPSGLTYAYIQNGSGTNMSQGALAFNVHSNNGLLSSEYYQVDVTGVGTYTFPANTVQLVIPNIAPGSYNFTVTIGCKSASGASNTACYLRFLSGTANIWAATTTVVDAFL